DRPCCFSVYLISTKLAKTSGLLFRLGAKETHKIVRFFRQNNRQNSERNS
ncbi:unnamed protein product, partial [Oikopleura dioica]